MLCEEAFYGNEGWGCGFSQRFSFGALKSFIDSYPFLHKLNIAAENV